MIGQSMTSGQRRIRFGIRGKLLLLSIAILSIPYVGYEYMRELERHLRSSLEASLVDAARAVAGPLHDSYQLFPYTGSAPEPTLFIHNLEYPIQVDGYTDDWINYLDWSDTYRPDPAMRVDSRALPLSFKLILGQLDQYLYALLQVHDDEVTYHQPTGEDIVDSDHVALVIGDNYGVKQKYYFSPSAPGRFNPFRIEKIVDEWEEREYVRYVTNIAAEWQETPEGFNLELSIPLSLLEERLGFIVGDVDDESERALKQSAGTAGPATIDRPGRLLRPSRQIGQIIRRLDMAPARRIWVLDQQGRVLASSGSLRRDLSQHPLNIFYTILLPPVSERFQDDLAGASRLQGNEVVAALNGETGARWRQTPDRKAVIVSAATPVWITDEVRGAVVVEETTNSIQMLQRHALASLFNKTLVVLLAVTLLLVLFATRLSVRLRRLSTEAARAIDEYGRVTGSLSASASGDEIGELSRNYSAMLERLKQYNNYLEGLAGKLSHELRTPMAVVQSSLDNLQSLAKGGEEKYLERAREGMQRLNLLVTRLSEAARLEHALQSADREEVDLGSLLAHCTENYRLAYPGANIELETPPERMTARISPDLFIQMLDKIVANAVDFSEKGQPVRLALSHTPDAMQIDVINRGPGLPAEMESQLFTSMVTVRRKAGNREPHLGLGLYIARMIAEYHGGSVRARNLSDGTGVCFSILIPARGSARPTVNA